MKVEKTARHDHIWFTAYHWTRQVLEHPRELCVLIDRTSASLQPHLVRLRLLQASSPRGAEIADESPARDIYGCGVGYEAEGSHI